MDRQARQQWAKRTAPATWGRGRAVRLSEELYATDSAIHLTICADAGRPFTIEAVARMACDSIERSAEMLAFRLYVYCLMPDHLHVLLSPTETAPDVSVLLDRFKSYTTNRYGKLGGDGRLWQPSARDRLKRPSEPLETLVAYIANNPVRSGLVQRWMEWPYTKVFVDL